jgi:tetratricopeptide (TPR) repeat protein
MTSRGFTNAQHLLSLGRVSEALAELDRDFDSEDPMCWWLRALALYYSGRVDDAMAAVQSGLRVDPDSSLLLELLAQCHLSRHDLAAAEEAVLAALRLDAEDADLFALYAQIVAAAGQTEKAQKLLAQARRLDPGHAGTVRVEAALAASRFDHDETLLRGRELLSIDPEDSRAHLLTGEVLHHRGDVDDAAEYLRTAVVSDPTDELAAEVARENLVWRHPLMWPLLPAKKFGPAKVWIAGILVLLLARTMRNNAITLTLAWVWIAYCVYSWVVPRIVRRLVR